MKKVAHIILLALGACVIIYVLYAIKFTNEKNGFTRNFHRQKMNLVKTVDLKTKSYTIVGVLNTNIKLNIYNDRFNLFQIGYGSDKLDTG